MAAMCASNMALIASPRSRALKPVVRTGTDGDEWMDDDEDEDEEEEEEEEDEEEGA